MAEDCDFIFGFCYLFKFSVTVKLTSFNFAKYLNSCQIDKYKFQHQQEQTSFSGTLSNKYQF